VFVHIKVRYVTDPSLNPFSHQHPTSGTKKTLAHVTEQFMWPWVSKDVYSLVCSKEYSQIHWWIWRKPLCVWGGGGKYQLDAQFNSTDKDVLHTSNLGGLGACPKRNFWKLKHSEIESASGSRYLTAVTVLLEYLGLGSFILCLLSPPCVSMHVQFLKSL